MKLSNIFSSGTHTENIRPANQQASIQNLQPTREQVSGFKPGQMLSGEVISKNGNEVQIRLNDDMILNARVDKNINLEVGKSMIFEVKSNGNTLNLSPLYTNVSAGVNVLKALDMAGLQVNSTSVSMTEQLMAAGLSVNQKFLLQVYREITGMAQGNVSDVIDLHKLGMPVNEANLSQMTSYRNLTHQLMDGMNTILGQLSGTLDSILADGDVLGAGRVYQALLDLVQGTGSGELIETGGGDITGLGNLGAENLALSNGGMSATTANGVGNVGTENSGLLNAGMVGDSDGVAGNPELVGISGGGAGNADAANSQTINGVFAENPTLESTVEIQNTITNELFQLLDSLPLPTQEGHALRAQLLQIAQGQTSGQFASNLQQLYALAEQIPGGVATLQKALAKQEVKGALLDIIKQQWTITPQEVAENGKVDELYQRLNSQLRDLTQILQDAGRQDSQVFQSVQNMSQNLDFMQQINQMYAYVQLPLRLQQGEAHGELYVYANRKRLTESDGAVSALLHLDMEHLGSVDVYVTLQSSKVSTRFYVRDDEMLDFLEAHMDILTERLAKRGYNCTFSMTTRDRAKEETTEGGIEAILNQEKGIVISQCAFDVRT